MILRESNKISKPRARIQKMKIQTTPHQGVYIGKYQLMFSGGKKGKM
jgi:hypothetical protein